MKIFTILFVLIIGFSAISSAKAQEPTPTPTTRISASSALVVPTVVRAGSGQNLEFQFWIFNENAQVAATDVVLTASLPSSVTFVSASVSVNGACSYADSIVTCNLGTVEKHPYDYSRILKIYVTPTAAGTVTLTGSIKGSNTLVSNFSITKTVAPAKSRKRVRFF